MDLSKVLGQLRRELVYLDAAILSLERLQTKALRRVRPPRVLVALRKGYPTGRRQTERGPTPQ